MNIRQFPNPFTVYSKKYGSTRHKWEKLFRTGYLWRQYDTKELFEYTIILKMPTVPKSVLNQFITHSEVYQRILDLKKKGKTVYDPKEYEI